MERNRNETGEGVSQIALADKALQQITTTITEVNSFNQQIAAASEEEQDRVNNTSNRISQIAAAAQATSEKASFGTTLAEQLNSISVRLQEYSKRFIL